ncbi:exported hypothetical protein [Candidatus Sulfopaludibacter sp. SbA4]|nr:exported hypothetical protein [Candidatus Sulfopaludibacter sp. SbA4]
MPKLLSSLGLLALAAMPLALMPAAAQAQGMPIQGTFTVQFEAIAAIAACGPNDTNCSVCLNNSGLYIEAQGIGNTSLGTLFLEIQKCYYNPGFGTYKGTFKMTAPNGKDSVKGTYTGKDDAPGDAYGFGPFSGTLTIAGGTGSLSRADGSISFTAVGGPATAGPSANTYVGMAFYSVQGRL